MTSSYHIWTTLVFHYVTALLKYVEHREHNIINVNVNRFSLDKVGIILDASSSNPVIISAV